MNEKSEIEETIEVDSITYFNEITVIFRLVVDRPSHRKVRYMRITHEESAFLRHPGESKTRCIFWTIETTLVSSEIVANCHIERDIGLGNDRRRHQHGSEYQRTH